MSREAFRTSKAALSQRQFHAERRAARKAAGLCTNCGEPSENKDGWCNSCREYTRIKNEARRKRYREQGFCYKCPKPAAPGFTHCEEHMVKARQRHKNFRQMVLDHYGRSCACCGETIEDFLTIDHINGGGNKHRKRLGSRGNGTALCKWLVDQEYPEGYQILCYNCNMAKSHHRECPHRRIVKSLLETHG